MAKIGYRSMVAAAVMAAGMSGVALADDGGDGGDNGMNPIYGDSWAALEGQGRSLGQPNPAPTGAFVAHEMDGQYPSVAEQFRQAQQRALAAGERFRQQTLSVMQGASAGSSASSAATDSSSSAYKIAPVNPKGQAPTIIGPATPPAENPSAKSTGG